MIQNNNQIVMVDDSELDIELMKRFYARSELENEFLSFLSGEEFLTYLDEIKDGKHPMPALVFLDINMPRMDGFEVLSNIRRKPEFNDLPIVTFLSNSDNPADIERCGELNAEIQEKFSDSETCVKFLNSLKGSKTILPKAM